MQLTFAAETALFILRHLRAQGGVPSARAELHDPDSSPAKRWRAACLDLVRFGIEESPSEEAPLWVCVGQSSARMRMKGVRSLVHSGTVPPGAFCDLGKGLYMSGPEMLFVEYAGRHTLAQTCLLAMELCGTYALDARAPRSGRAKLDIAPVTSIEKLRRFVQGCRGVRGLTRARQALCYSSDDAWSPMESPVAVMMMLPLKEYGYGLGHCSLNIRVDTENGVPGAASKGTRVPDILIDGTHVGVNYDGAVHLDLKPVVDAAFEMGLNPGSSRTEQIVRDSVAMVRAKAVEDLRRNRDLAAAGYDVFPVVKEDLYERNALDGVVWQLLEVLEARSRRRRPLLRQALESEFAAEERYRLMRSMIPNYDTSLDEPLSRSDVFINFDARP